MIQHQVTRKAAVVVLAMALAACSESDGPMTGLGTTAGGAIAPAASAHHDLAEDEPGVRIVTGTGDFTAQLAQYRALMGALSPNLAGEQAGERREINWDAVPLALTNTSDFPGEFFNRTTVPGSPRGVVFTTNGSSFQISNNGFVNVNPLYAGEFNNFSPPNLFAATGGTITDVHFFVAGSTTPATVTGFGAVFADVERRNSTTIEYFDARGERLLRLSVPVRSDEKGLSFAGAKFDARIVARVRITTGDAPIGATVLDNIRGPGRKRDLVVMDDFIYGEPRPATP